MHGISNVNVSVETIGVKCQYVMILTMTASLRMLMLRTGILDTGRGINCLRNDTRARYVYDVITPSMHCTCGTEYL